MQYASSYIAIIMTRKVFFLPIFLLLICFSFSSSAQKNIGHKKEIDKYIKAEMARQQIPGLTYAVINNDKIIDSGAYGYANVELHAPVIIHSLFSIGSIGKTFTATAIMLLQKQGKLSINDPINKYLDSLPDEWKNITIKNLLTHTSGIKDYSPDFPGYPIINRDRKQEITEAQFIKLAASEPLNFKPGERWAYSNSNFVLLGFIIHKTSGKTLPEFMKENIFDVAGMKETCYISLNEIIPNRASGYLLDEDNDNRLIPGKYVSDFYSTMGDMGIITSALDMAKWSIALDERKILDKQTLQEMWQPAKLNNGQEAEGLVGNEYGMGWFVSNHRSFKEIGHGGDFINGYSADFVRFDELHIAVVVLCNLNQANPHFISLDLAGFYVPELKGIDQMIPEQTSDTSFKNKVHTLLSEIGNDNLDTTLVTENFKEKINPVTKMLFQHQPVDESSITFVHSDNIVNKNFLCDGTLIQKINYCKIKVGNETHYLALYLTMNNKIADMIGY